MKKSRVETAETRRRIVEVATRAFRTNGIHATGVAEIMLAAGMTHGGFYRHFASKDQLVAEACAAGMEAIVDSVGTAAEGGEEAFLKHIQTFLSDETRDDCLAGCPLVAMGSELARADMETRRAASQGFRELIDIIASRGRSSDTPSATGDAIFMLSTIIGAVTMSRIVDDPELSDLILDETRKRLTTLCVKPRETSLS